MSCVTSGVGIVKSYFGHVIPSKAVKLVPKNVTLEMQDLAEVMNFFFFGSFPS